MEKHVIDYIHQVWGSRDRFPGPQPISIERKHFPTLKKNAYVVCEKTDGERYMLVATRWQNRNVSVFVNRSFRMVETHLNLPKNAYDGTILDGELCDGGVFMAYDGIVVCGQPVGHMHLIDRYGCVEQCIKRIVAMKSDPHRVRLKKFYVLHDFEIFQREHLPQVQQKVDGLVFTPVYEPVRMGTHETMFKWKPRDHNTVDFQMKRDQYRPGVWRLYVQEKGKLVYETELHNYEEPWFEEDAIVECQYMTEDVPMWWRPIKRRMDKTHPNNRRTFYRTLVNIKEDIQMSEFNNIV